MAKILLVEPDKILAQIYITAFERSGHHVVHTSDAQTAITYADKNLPDCVVLEIQLSNHNGIEFLYEFRSYNDWQQVPVIIHSLIHPREFADNDALWKLIKISDYIYKPQSTLKLLISSIDVCLRNSELKAVDKKQEIV